MSQAEHTILDHLNPVFEELFGLPKINSYKFNVQFKDGKTAEIGIKEPTLKQARKTLNHWYPNIDIELGFKEL